MDKPTAAANAAQKIEKQARQLAYDTRYKVKQSMKTTSGSKLDPAAVRRAYEAQLSKSSAPPAVKARAKKMLLGEDFVADIQERVTDNVANALYKVFVEGVQKEEEPIVLTYMEKLETAEHRKYKVRVTDKKTNNSYVRYATREKISELRANPNIASVEMTGYGEPGEDEKKGGKQTAAAKAGKDYDGDGEIESGAKEYRGAVHNAIQRKKGGTPDGKDTSSVKEEFLGEVSEKEKTGKIKPMGPNESNKVIISPEVPGSRNDRNMSGRLQMAHHELEGPFIAEKAVSQAQQKFMGMVYAAKKGAKPASPEVAKAAAGMTGKEAKKFAKTKHEGLPVHKEETACGDESKSNKGEDDSRSIPTKVNLMKNKLRSMGLKMSYEPEGEVVSEEESDRTSDRARQGGDWRSRSQRPVTRRPSVADDPRYGSMTDKEWASSSRNPANKPRPRRRTY